VLAVLSIGLLFMAGIALSALGARPFELTGQEMQWVQVPVYPQAQYALPRTQQMQMQQPQMQQPQMQQQQMQMQQQLDAGADAAAEPAAVQAPPMQPAAVQAPPMQPGQAPPMRPQMQPQVQPPMQPGEQAAAAQPLATQPAPPKPPMRDWSKIKKDVSAKAGGAGFGSAGPTSAAEGADESVEDYQKVKTERRQAMDFCDAKFSSWANIQKCIHLLFKNAHY